MLQSSGASKCTRRLLLEAIMQLEHATTHFIPQDGRIALSSHDRHALHSLQSIATYHQRMQAAGKTPVVEAPQGTPLPALSGAAMDVDGHHEEDSDDEDERWAQGLEVGLRGRVQCYA